MSRFDFHGRLYRSTQRRRDPGGYEHPFSPKEKKAFLQESFSKLREGLSFVYVQYHESSITASVNRDCNLKVSIYNQCVRIEVDRRINGVWKSSVYSNPEDVIKELK